MMIEPPIDELVEKMDGNKYKLSIVMAKLVGALLPLFAKICKLDPAVVASPFMTTIVDVLALIIYCAISIPILA